MVCCTGVLCGGKDIFLRLLSKNPSIKELDCLGAGIEVTGEVTKDLDEWPFVEDIAFRDSSCCLASLQKNTQFISNSTIVQCLFNHFHLNSRKNNNHRDFTKSLSEDQV